MFEIPKGKVVSWDCETTGLHTFKGDRPYCFSFANTQGETAVASFKVNPKNRTVEYQSSPEIFEKLRTFFEDKSIAKVAHNAQFDVKMCKAAGLEVKGEIICTMNLIRLVKSDAPVALKKFCSQYLGISDDDEKELKEATRIARREGKAKGYSIYAGSGGEDGQLAPDYWLAPKSLVEKYAITDAARCMAVYCALFPEIRKKGLEKLWDQEQATWKILRKIERRGIRIFPEKVDATIQSLKKKLLIFKKQIPDGINPNSSLQLRSLFYDKLKESQLYSTKAGFPSTDVDALKAFKHSLAKTILNIRACNKTIEFMKQYKFFMRPHKDGNWYIHPTIHQAMTTTGRDSMSDPNLQQVAKGRNTTGADILVEARSVFGSRPNYIMHSYDWSGQEVYIPAFASKEPKLVDMLMKGEDPHQYTSDSLTRQIGEFIDRDKSKQSFFSLLYGIGKEKLAKKLGVKISLAEYIKHIFKKTYERLHEWEEELKYEAQSKGFIRTQYGRIIYISNEETYKAPNYFVQGTAGGILRNARIKIHERIPEAKIVLPIHDELLIESKVNVDKKVVACMQDNPELNMPIPIPVSISAIGASWADKTKI